MSVSRLLVPLALLPLFSCGPARDAFAPLCPEVKLIPALADVTRYAGSSPTHDLTDMVLQGRVVAVNGKCQAGDDKAVLPATVTVSLSLQRGPAMKGRDADLPVFLVVSEGGEVRDKKIFQVHLTFPPNVDRMTITSPNIDLSLPVTPEKSGAAYRIIAGFQLTPEELAANRQADGG